MRKIYLILMVIATIFFVACKNEKHESDDKKADTTLLVKEIEKKDEIKVMVEEVKIQQILSIRRKVEMKRIGEEMGSMYGELMTYIEKNKYKVSGVPIAIYHEWSFEMNDIECGIPVEGSVKSTKNISISKSYEGKVVTAIHIGSYDKVTPVWMAIDKYIKDNKLEENGAPWEEYITDPQAEPDSTKWQTKLYQPIK